MFIIPQLWYCSFWLLPFFQHQLTHLMSPSTGDLPPPAVWSLTTDHLVVPSRPLWPVHSQGNFRVNRPNKWKLQMMTHGKIKCQPTLSSLILRQVLNTVVFPRMYLLLKPGLRPLRPALSVSMVAITWSFLTFSPTCQTLHATPAVGCLKVWPKSIKDVAVSCKLSLQRSLR